MKEFYDLIDAIYAELNSNPFVNTVTFGDIMKVDLSKQTIFPSSHITIRSATFNEHTVDFELQVMSMDIVDESKEDKLSLIHI